MSPEPRNSKKALSAGLLNLFVKLLVHSPRDLDPKLAHQWDNLPMDIVQQALEDFLKNPPLGILKYAGYRMIPIGIQKFSVLEKLLSEPGCGTNISIAGCDESFRATWAGYESTCFYSFVDFYDLLENAVDELVYQVLGGDPKGLTTPMEIEALLAAQPDGKSGALLNDGRRNVFFLPAEKKKIQKISITWRRHGWHIAQREAMTLVACSKDSRIFSRG